ncbi:MAG: hypothetical protein QM811_23715 [Pirellulales bacterium]
MNPFLPCAAVTGSLIAPQLGHHRVDVANEIRMDDGVDFSDLDRNRQRRAVERKTDFGRAVLLRPQQPVGGQRHGVGRAAGRLRGDPRDVDPFAFVGDGFDHQLREIEFAAQRDRPRGRDGQRRDLGSRRQFFRNGVRGERGRDDAQQRPASEMAKDHGVHFENVCRLREPLDFASISIPRAFARG